MAKHNRLLWRIYSYFLAATLITLAITTWLAVNSLQRFMEEETTHKLIVRAKMVAETIAEHDLSNTGNINKVTLKMSSLTEARITVVSAGGTVLADSDKKPKQMDNHANRPEIATALSGTIGESVRFSNTLKKRLKYVAIPLNRDGHITSVIRLSQPIAEIHWTQRIIIHQIILGAACAALFFALVALYLSRQITQPLEEMRRTAEQLANGNLSSHLNIFSTDEIGALAHSINKMARQLDKRIKTIARQKVEQNAMLACMTEGVLAIDQDELILYMNNTAAKMLNTTPNLTQGVSVQKCIRNHELHNFITEALTRHNTVQAEITINNNGEHRIQLHCTPLTDPTGWNIGALIVLNDITDIKRLETMRKDFVANVSHELKTPITALKGCVETLTSDTPPTKEESAGFINMMARHINRLEAIVEDLLNLSRIEFEMTENNISFAPVSICKVLQQTKQTFSEQLKTKNIKLEIRCSNPLTASANAALLEQAVGNLIDNAIKYSGKNSCIDISAKLINKQITITISDQGPGIDQQHLPRIFERFYRVDKARSRAFGGTGLGLAIAKHIILAHQGTITVKSTPGKGSIFAINIPAPKI